ncbi:MAG: hypothetical protein AAFZ15_28210 [Bacteroidota bacterium]
MKTLKLISTAILILVSVTVFSQNNRLAKFSAHPMLNKEWSPTDNWLHAFKNNFGKQLATNWIEELAFSGTFYQTKKLDGILLVTPDFIESSSQMHAKISAKNDTFILANV